MKDDSEGDEGGEDRLLALIALWLDAAAEFGDRDDAGIELSGFDDSRAEAALLRIAVDPAADEDLADRAGESLHELWKRSGRHPVDLIAAMHPAARKFFTS